MSLNNHITKGLIVLMSTLILMLTSCASGPDDIQKDFTLHYPAISNIAAGKNMVLKPSWYGGAPTEFVITSITLEGKSVQTDCFSVDSNSGEFSMSDTEGLSIGTYKISLSCQASGRTYNFPDLIIVEMMKPVPDGIVMEPSELTVSLSDVYETNDEVVLPTSKVVSVGDVHVTIKDYALANVYKDGELANHYLSWFDISDDGVFSIVKNNTDFLTGTYTFDIRLTTYFVDSEDDSGLFADALELKVVSPPFGLKYSPESVRLEENTAARSSVPVCYGSPDGLKYEIKSVSPSNAVGISVDQNTGVLTVREGTTSAGETLTVSLTVSNDYGSADFENAFVFEVVEYIAPITVFEYADVPRKLSGAAFSNAPVKKDGKEVSYSFVDLPEVLSSLKLSDDGTVSSEPGVELPHGQYTVTVRAQNVKGFKDAQFTIDIANFTYVLWGNNLGTDGEPLTPKSKYGNQFRLEAVSNNSLVIELDEAEHDIPEGYDVHFSIVGDDGVSGISVDDSGKLTFKVNATSTRLLYRTVQVEVSDQDYTIRRRIPVFLDRYSKSTCKVMYTPFVYRVNPRTGGLSDCEITFSDGASPAYMDIYKELAYYNLDGPESHEYNGVFKNELLKTSFLHFVWDRYYTDMGASIPGNMSNNPVSYNKNQSAGTLNKAAAYVDPTAGYQIRVNPGKFKDTEGNYADGVMKTYFTFDSSESKGPDRVIIWFDSTYNQENSSVTE